MQFSLPKPKRRPRRTAQSGRVVAARRSKPLFRRLLLAALLAASLGALSATYRDGVAVHSVQLAAIEVVSPIERGLNRAWDPVVDGWDWTKRLFTAMSDNPKLERENEQLRTAIRAAQVHEAENAELRALLNLEEAASYPSGYSAVRGRVFSRAAGSTDRSVLIDIGTKDGIRVNDSVMVASGLIGRVTATTRNTARVSLILDNAQHVTVKVVGAEGGTGVLEPVSIDGVPAMRIQFVEQSAKVRKGDLVVTAGWVDHGRSLQSLFPAGIPVGEVVSVGNSSADLYKVIQIVPFVNFENIEHVAVLAPTDRARQAGLAVPPRTSVDKARRTDAARSDTAAKKANAKSASKSDTSDSVDLKKKAAEL